MDQAKNSGGSKVVRPRRPRGTLIMDNFAYGRSEIPVAWAPAPPTGTGTGTFEPIWSKPKEPPRRRPPQKSYSYIDGQPWVDHPPARHVYENSDEIEKNKKLIEEVHRKAEQVSGGFDLWHPRNFHPLPSDGIDYLDRNLIAFHLREDLKYHEEMFKRQYSYGSMAYNSSDPFTGSIEARHCLTVRSERPFFWMDKSSGIRWVGIYGINAVCVVTLCGHVDWKRVHGGLATTDSTTVLSFFRKCVLSELEDLADPSKEARYRFDVPFCVASATPDTLETPIKGGVEMSSVDYAAKAIDFVRSSGLLPMVEDSGAAIRLAISAFERLIGKKCEAEEIEVTVVSNRRHGIPSLKHLDISEIADNLKALINNTSEAAV